MYLFILTFPLVVLTNGISPVGFPDYRSQRRPTGQTNGLGHLAFVCVVCHLLGFVVFACVYFCVYFLAVLTYKQNEGNTNDEWLTHFQVRVNTFKIHWN